MKQVPHRGEQYDSTGGLYGAVEEDIPTNLYVPAPSSGELPSSVDLSKDMYFPPIGNQQGGSCVAWSTTYYQFTYEAAKLNGWNAKEDFGKVASPKFVWNYVNEGENKGVSAENCYNILMNYGAVHWSEFPQNDSTLDLGWYSGSSDEETSEVLHEALKTRVSSYVNRQFADKNKTAYTPTIKRVNDSVLYDMKSKLNDKHPLVIYTHINSFYVDNISNGERACLYQNGNEGYHAMTVVGYNDNVYYDLNKNGKIESFEYGAFLVANSWGNNRDNDGFIWVMYDALNQVSNVANCNMEGREPAFENYNYFFINVQKYNCDLTAQVSIEQSNRGDFSIEMGKSETRTASKTIVNKFENNCGGSIGFNGRDNTRLSHMLMFDFTSFYQGSNMDYWLKITDKRVGNQTIVKSIKWVNSLGNVIKEIGRQDAIDNASSQYDSSAITSIVLGSYSLKVGKTTKMSPKISPANAFNRTLTWSSSDSTVASINSNGEITGHKPGNVTITATATDGSGVSVSKNYTVSDDCGNTMDTASTINFELKKKASIEYIGDLDYFKFTPKTSGKYYIFSLGTTDTVGTVLNSDGTTVTNGFNNDYNGTNFCVCVDLLAGKVYYLKVRGNGKATGEYTVGITYGKIYSWDVPDLNPDARHVRMTAEMPSFLNQLSVQVGNTIYLLEKHNNSTFTGTIKGRIFNVAFSTSHDGLLTLWQIDAHLPATPSGQTQNIIFKGSCDSKTAISPVSATVSGFFAYASRIKTGIDPNSNLYVFKNETMAEQGYVITIRSWNNELVDATTSAKIATGMKVIKVDSSTGKIVEISYVVLFGDVTGNGTVGDGKITVTDSLAVLQDAVNKSKLPTAIAAIAADVDHDGEITTQDSLMINQASTDKITLDQDFHIEDVPDECYYLDPIIF